jgi:glycosyltransferase involved in cell wall biosynthesis
LKEKYKTADTHIQSSIPKASSISVIIVVFNDAKHLEDSILSVINQTSSNIDFIIVDGCSTDGSIDIIKKYQDYLTYWSSEPDKGIYDAMNKGWDYANINSHILFLGAGDTIIKMPSDLNLKQDCIYFGDVVLGNTGIFNAKADFRLKIGNTVHHQALLIPKKLHPKPPFDIQYKVYADFDFNQRLLKSKFNFIKTDQLKSYVMPGGFSQHYKTIEWYYIIKNNFGLFYALLGYIYYMFQMIRKKTPSI